MNIVAVFKKDSKFIFFKKLYSERHVIYLMKKDPFNDNPEENEFIVEWEHEDHT